MTLSRMNRHRAAGGVAFGDVTYAPGGVFGPRVQEDHQLVALLSGEAQIEVDGGEVALAEGQAILLLPGGTERFRFAQTRPSRHLWCAVRPDLVSDALHAQLAALPRPFDLHGRSLALLEQGLDLPASPLPEATAVLGGLGLLTLVSVVFEAASTLGGREPEALGRARAYLNAHLAEPLTLELVARAVHLSPQHLTRLFRAHLGTTPMRFLWQLRVQRGVDLLGATGLPVSAIAEQVGFQSPFHFSRLVRARHGLSPRALRALRWRGGPGV